MSPSESAPRVAVSKRPGARRYEGREGRYEVVLDSVPTAVFLADAEGHIVYANPRMVDILGHPVATLTTMTVDDLWVGRPRSPHSERIRGFCTRPSSMKPTTGLQLKALHRDGGAIPVEISLGAMAHAGRTFTIVTLCDSTVAALSPDAAAGLAAARHARREDVIGAAGLTSREREVLELLLLGRTYAEIGLVLAITPRTAKYHQQNILKKLGAESRFDLLRLFV